jgi:hypothetical protein
VRAAKTLADGWAGGDPVLESKAVPVIFSEGTYEMVAREPRERGSHAALLVHIPVLARGRVCSTVSQRCANRVSVALVAAHSVNEPLPTSGSPSHPRYWSALPWQQ